MRIPTYPKKIIIVSSGQPSLNPRLVKEADSLAQAGYNVTVFYAYWNDWGTEYDKQLLANSKWQAIRIGGSPKQGRLKYFISRLIYKVARQVKIDLFTTISVARSSYALINEVKKHKADLYIAHNLGALPAAVISAKKYSKPCGFDAEDLHRNEVSDDPDNADVKRKTFVEDKYIPQVNYLTASSPEIAAVYSKLFPKLNPVVILNVFNKSSTLINKVHKPLKLFWFSQSVGAGRGIEDVVKALTTLNKDDFELHLLGHRTVYNRGFIETLKLNNIHIKFHDPIAPIDVIPFAAQFDIGLALEPGFIINNNLALSNKIFTYLQAGLCIIASKTTAQADFMRQNASVGSAYLPGDVKALSDILSFYQQHPEEITTCKEASLKLARERYNWETESRKFLKLVEETV